MPNRIIRESCRTSPNLDALSDMAERMFWRLTTVADDFGRFEASPKVLLASCFPLKVGEIKPQKILLLYIELEKQGLVITYKVKDKTYGYFVNWDKHQQRRAKRSKYPVPADDNICKHIPADSFEESRIRGIEDSSELPKEASEPPVLIFPTVGEKKEWGLNNALLLSLKNGYPGVDVDIALKNALTWCITNPKKRKTHDGMPKFLNSWMAREQNRPGKNIDQTGFTRYDQLKARMEAESGSR